MPYIKKGDFDISLWEETINAEYNEREKARIDTLKTTICILKDYFKDKCVKRVLIVGSILKEGSFYPFSDVDIAVEGLRERYFRTLAELENLIARDVVLIELENCRFRDSIEKQGVVVI